MARPPLSADELLVISHRCADVFVAAGGARATVTDLAAAAKMSERTFYRYFPTKEDSLRPLFDDGLSRYVAALATQPTPGDAPTAIMRAIEQTFAGDDEVHTRALMGTVVGDPALRRIWLEASYEAAQRLRPHIAALTEADDVTNSVMAGQAALLVVVAIEQLIRTGVPMSVAARAAAHAMFGPLTEPPEGPKG
jgi:AcrR family transcriptional regulator